MLRPKVISSTLIPIVACLLALAMVSWPLTSCSEWDTETAGAAFVPSNSQVRAFTHPLYVEYSPDDVRIWGPALAQVQVDADHLHVSIDNAADSLALFVYGFPATVDTLGISDASLTVSSSTPYALYLAGLSLRSQDDAVLRSLGQAACHIVLPQGSSNKLFGRATFAGPLTISGRGSLAIHSLGTSLTATSLQCQYDVSLALTSQQADGIALSGFMRSSQGNWTIQAQRNGITTPDSIMLIAGSYQGTAADGAFLDAECGVYLRQASLKAVSAWFSNMHDSAYIAQRYDSVWGVWQDQFPDLVLQADTVYDILLNASSSRTASITPRYDVSQPWLLYSDGKVMTTDSLHLR